MVCLSPGYADWYLIFALAIVELCWVFFICFCVSSLFHTFQTYFCTEEMLILVDASPILWLLECEEL